MQQPVLEVLDPVLHFVQFNGVRHRVLSCIRQFEDTPARTFVLLVARPSVR